MARNQLENPVILYDSPPSPCARRVRMSLIEKGIPFETRLIDLTAGDQKKPEFLAINPHGKVPALIHGDRVLYESNVITEYLDEAFDTLPLYPGDPAEYFAVKAWQDYERVFAQTYFQLMYATLFGPMARATKTKEEYDRETANSSDDPAFHAYRASVWAGTVLSAAQIDEHKARLTEVLDRLETALEGRDWLVGTGFSQAEISIYPRLVMFPWLGVEIPRQRYPNLTGWIARLADRPSFVKTESGLGKAMQKPLVRAQMRWLKSYFDTPPAKRGPVMNLRFRLMQRVLKAKTADTASEEAAIRAVEAELAHNAIEERAICPPAPGGTGPLTLTGPAQSPALAALHGAARAAGLAHSIVPGQTPGAATATVQVSGLAEALILIDRQSGGALMPRTPFGRAQVRLWLERDCEGETKYLGALRTDGASPAERQAALNWLGKRWRRLGAELGGQDFILGDLSLADFALWAQLDEDLDRGLELGGLPEAVRAWRSRMAAQIGQDPGAAQNQS